MGKPCESITECSGVPQLSEYHYCGTLQHSASPQQGGFSGGEICLSFPTKPVTISNVCCLEICAGTLFLMLLKFGAVLSINCGFLMAIYTWIHLQQHIVVVRSFLRMLKLHKLAVHKLYLSRGGRTTCQGVLDYGLNRHRNIPLIFQYNKLQQSKTVLFGMHVCQLMKIQCC